VEDKSSLPQGQGKPASLAEQPNDKAAGIPVSDVNPATNWAPSAADMMTPPSDGSGFPEAAGTGIPEGAASAPSFSGQPYLYHPSFSGYAKPVESVRGSRLNVMSKPTETAASTSKPYGGLS
jgi:hypothetical protein